jgi:hypothetical protein
VGAVALARLSPRVALSLRSLKAASNIEFTLLLQVVFLKLLEAVNTLSMSCSEGVVALVVVVVVLVVIEAQSQVNCPVVEHQPKSKPYSSPEAIQSLLVLVVLATTLGALVVARLLVEVALYRQ